MRTYLDLLKMVLEQGEPREDRTGTGTLSCFGLQARYDLREGFPILTTKKVLFSSIVKELLWFLRGETEIATLGCGIWDAWADERGQLGPIYGHQWRRWGADQEQPGIDQIAQVVEAIRTTPESRRLIVSAWNVEALPEMALPPCHTFFQFYTGQDGSLDLQLYQRSADMAVGVPFNIASYALLLAMVAKATGREARHFVHTIGDGHIYLNHVDGVKRQLKRSPGALPTLEIKKMPDFSAPEAMTLSHEDIVLHGYEHAPFIRFPVAV